MRDKITHRLDLEARQKIERLSKTGYRPVVIARRIGISRQALYKELKRSDVTDIKLYDAARAEKLAEIRRHNSGRKKKHKKDG